jgi:hypothetical protein
MAAYTKCVNFKDGYMENVMEYRYEILAHFNFEYEVSKNASFQKKYFLASVTSTDVGANWLQLVLAFT